MMGSQNSSCRSFYFSTCSVVAWGIYEPIFEFVYGCIGVGDSSCQLWRCSMGERGMGGSGGIGMGTWDVLDGSDGNLV